MRVHSLIRPHLLGVFTILGPVSRKSRNFLGLFWVPQSGRNSLHTFAMPRFYAIKLRNPLGFSYIQNTLKDQLFKKSGLQFCNWLLGPEKFSGHSRNRPLIFSALNLAVSKKSQSPTLSLLATNERIRQIIISDK